MATNGDDDEDSGSSSSSSSNRLLSLIITDMHIITKLFFVAPMWRVTAATSEAAHTRQPSET